MQGQRGAAGMRYEYSTIFLLLDSLGLYGLS